MTYCDFKPGDEVVCVAVKRVPADYEGTRLRVGSVYVVEQVLLWNGDAGVVLVGHHSTHPTGAYLARAFRKVQRRDLGAWLETATDFEEPRRVPKKERVS